MIKVSNAAAQTLQPGAAVTFDKTPVPLRTGCGECFNASLPQSVKLCARGVYRISFSGNISADAATTPIQLAIAIGGTPMLDTVMKATPAAAGDFVNVSVSTIIKNCCCDLDRVSVVNSGTNPLTLDANSNLNIARCS